MERKEGEKGGKKERMRHKQTKRERNTQKKKEGMKGS